MKKLIMSAAVLALFLTGCAVSEKDIQLELLKQLECTEDYNKYLELEAEDRLDDLGNYVLSSESSEVLTDEQIPEGSVRVTFAENQRIGVKYYYDKEHTKPVEDNVCWLNEGDCIYASAPVIQNAASNTYYFERFRVIRYDENGDKQGELKCDDYEPGLVLQIPMNSGCSDYSVEPVGAYENRVLTLSDFRIGDDGNKVELPGTWIINDTEVNGVSYEISSVSPYAVTYRYNADEYFVVGSQPNFYTHNANDGEASFGNIDPSGGTENFSVELHTYIQGLIEAQDEDVSVTVNGEKHVLPQSLQRLRYGDVLAIITPPDYKLTCEQITLPSPEKQSNGFMYSITIPEGVDELRLHVRKWLQKDISFEVPTINQWNPLESWKDYEEDKLLRVSVVASSGLHTDYSYRDLRDGAKVTMNESDRLEISLTDEINDHPNVVFAISVNGANPIYVSRSSEQKTVSLRYDQAEKIKITHENGYVFTYKNIDNGVITVRYCVDSNGSARDIAEGEFLPAGTNVSIAVLDIPSGYRITGGAVREGSAFGNIIISEKTNIADFVVNSAYTDNY